MVLLELFKELFKITFGFFAEWLTKLVMDLMEPNEA
jgi:hypothetical protein